MELRIWLQFSVCRCGTATLHELYVCSVHCPIGWLWLQPTVNTSFMPFQWYSVPGDATTLRISAYDFMSFPVRIVFFAFVQQRLAKATWTEQKKQDIATISLTCFSNKRRWLHVYIVGFWLTAYSCRRSPNKWFVSLCLRWHCSSCSSHTVENVAQMWYIRGEAATPTVNGWLLLAFVHCLWPYALMLFFFMFACAANDNEERIFSFDEEFWTHSKDVKCVSRKYFNLIDVKLRCETSNDTDLTMMSIIRAFDGWICTEQ